MPLATISIAVAMIGSVHGTQSKLKDTTLATWGAAVLEQIRKEYYNPKTGLYADSATQKGQSGPAFCWGAGVMLSALNAAAEYDPKRYAGWLLGYLHVIPQYWNSSGPVGGFDVSPNSTSPDRYYDDNEWMIRDLVNSYQLTGQYSFLKLAEKSADFVWSGYDKKLGGGIYWHEQSKTSKNTCSNAPAANAFLQLYLASKDGKYLKEAKEIYNWTLVNLRDPVTGLYWDNINLDGSIQKTFWSYNTALMIEDATLLFSITHEEKYRMQAVATDSAAVQYWLGLGPVLKDGGKFGFLLIEAMYMRQSLAPSDYFKYGGLDQAIEALTWIHRHAHDRHGRYGDRWDKPVKRDLKQWSLIDQACVARVYFEIANLLKGNPMH